MTFVLNHQTNSDHKIQVTSESVTPFFIIMAEGVNQQKDKYLPKPTDTCKTRIASALLSLNPSSRIRRFPITSFCKYEPAKMTSNIPCLMESMIRIEERWSLLTLRMRTMKHGVPVSMLFHASLSRHKDQESQWEENTCSSCEFQVLIVWHREEESNSSHFKLVASKTSTYYRIEEGRM